MLPPTSPKVLLANPILEAFGNAKTVRNNNSSRFGKLIDVNFDHDSRISSSLIHNYLLEKSRLVAQVRARRRIPTSPRIPPLSRHTLLVAQAPDERNFHYFYQLCAGADDEEYARLSLGPPSSFALLASSGCVDIDGVDDGEELMATRNALAQLAFTAEEVRLTAEVAAAVLHLGQLEFRRLRGSIGEGDKYSESCRIALDDGPLLLAAGLLGVDAEAMQKCIVCRSMNIKGGGDVSIEEIPLSADKAASSRDALAKLLYAKLFDWLVGRINAALTADAGGAAAAAKICILDIFGFEIFEHNSFEQASRDPIANEPSSPRHFPPLSPRHSSSRWSSC